MAKKGKKGGKKGKKKKVVQQDPNALTEVDKTFYELTIADLNRKLARLRSLTQELELKNEELQETIDKLDEDKSDIITYLKRMLEEKTNEIKELEERIAGLQDTRQNETEQFEARIEELENEYKTMHEQLTSENKLLEGKLNSLEEFRSQRDDLMKKFEQQENDMEGQEKRHVREMYEIERKFIISKDKLKKDMEARLLQLSTEFRDASELRIAATTHRVIRENIAVNNELDVMLSSHQKLLSELNSLKTNSKTWRQESELHNQEKKKTLLKVRVQLKLIERLTQDNRKLNHVLEKYKRFDTEILESRTLVKVTNEKFSEFTMRIKLLEQNLERKSCEKVSMQTELDYLKEENARLKDVLFESVSCIKEAMTVKTESDFSIKSAKRENLLITLFGLLNKAHEHKIARPSLDTIGSVQSAYQRGDLGFVPKVIDPIRPIVPTNRTIDTQTGASFENFLETGYICPPYQEQYTEYDDNELEYLELMEVESEIEVEEMQPKISVLFFDENEAPEEESEGDSKVFDPFAEGLSSGSSQLSQHSDKEKIGTKSSKQEAESSKTPDTSERQPISSKKSSKGSASSESKEIKISSATAVGSKTSAGSKKSIEKQSSKTGTSKLESASKLAKTSKSSLRGSKQSLQQTGDSKSTKKSISSKESIKQKSDSKEN